MRETAHRACHRLTVALVAAATLGVGATASAEVPPPATPIAPDSGALTGSPATDEAIAGASASRLAWQAARETDAARTSREGSRSAYRDLSDAEAIDAIRSTYPRLLSQPLWSPPPLGPGETIDGFSDDLTAKIAGPDGTEATIHSATPIRSSLGAGEPGLVDISLSQAPGGTYAPANPLVAYSLPGSLAEGVRFDDGPLGVRFPDARDVATQRADAKLAYLNAWADTDLVLSPLPEGFSTTQVLRSPASPESYRVDLDLPAGAELRDVGGEGDPAGAVVELAGGEGRLSITSPVAFDADGVAVETSLRVAGADSLEVGIAHREEDLRYPLELDPTYSFCHGGCADYWNDWSNWTPNYGNWGFHSGDFFGTYGLVIYPHWETTHPDWYGLGEYAYWQWQGAFLRNENLYRYFSGDLSGGGYNAWAVHGVQDPPTARWLSGVARVNQGAYDTHSPWVPYATLGGHTNWTIDHCFIGESPTSCNLAALAEHNPDLTGRRPTMQASWVSGASYGMETYVFMRYAYAYTVRDWEVPPLPTPPHDTRIDSSPPAQTNSSTATFNFSAKAPTGGSALPGTTFECQLDSGPWQQCANPKTYNGLTDGTHTFQVRAKDILDQRDPTPASHSWLVDTTPPGGYLVEPENYLYGTFAFRGTMEDGGSGPRNWTFELKRLGDATWHQPCGPTSTREASGLYACSWNTANGQFPDAGDYQIRARLTDNVGNSSYTETWTNITVANGRESDEPEAPTDPTEAGEEPGPGLPDTFYESPAPNTAPDEAGGDYSSVDVDEAQLSCSEDDEFAEELIPEYGFILPGERDAPQGLPAPEVALAEFLSLPVVPRIPVSEFIAIQRTSDSAVFGAYEDGELRAVVDVLANGNGTWLTTRMEGCSLFLSRFDLPELTTQSEGAGLTEGSAREDWGSGNDSARDSVNAILGATL